MRPPDVMKLNHITNRETNQLLQARSGGGGVGECTRTFLPKTLTENKHTVSFVIFYVQFLVT